MFKRGRDVENLVELYLPGDWLGFCLAPKPKIRTLENCAKMGPKERHGAYFAVVGRRKSDLLILKDAAERDGLSGGELCT
jgi:hypothetical protein